MICKLAIRPLSNYFRINISLNHLNVLFEHTGWLVRSYKIAQNDVFSRDNDENDRFRLRNYSYNYLAGTTILDKDVGDKMCLRYWGQLWSPTSQRCHQYLKLSPSLGDLVNQHLSLRSHQHHYSL